MTLRSLTAGLRALFRGTRVNAELDEELADFVDRATEENVRSGMTRDDARRVARAQMGSASAARETALSGGWDATAKTLLGDVRHGLRAARRKPGFAAAVILTMALGIGANTAMFSVVNAVMLRPLPWRDAERLVLIWTDDVRRGLHRETTASRTIDEWRASARTLEGIGYFTTGRVAPMTNGGAERGRSRQALVSGNLFALLGVAPAKGRTISPLDESERASVAVISYGFWQRWFGGAGDVVGKTIEMDDASKGGLGALTVVGVMPLGFYFPDQQTEIWTPASTYWRFSRESQEYFPAWARRWTGVGRVKPGASMDDVRADLDRVGRQLSATHASDVPDFPGFRTTVLSVLDSITGQSLQSALWTLLAAVSVVLLIACVNVANLLLARGASRQQEFAIRRALGAGRGRLVRQLVTESVVLSVAGGAVGTLVATWATRLLGVAATGFVPRIGEISTDWRVMTFAFTASVLSGVLFGLGPAVRLSKADVGDALREGARGTARPQLRRSRDVLVMAECALAITLLTGAGLLLRSLAQLQAVDPGFDPSHVLAVRIEFPTEAAPAASERTQTSSAEQARARGRIATASVMLDAVRALPSVTAVGVSDDLFIGGVGNNSITIPGRSELELGAGELNDGSLTPGFFGVLRVQVRRGRLLTNDDFERKAIALWSPVVTHMSLAEKERLAVPEPVVVNETFVRRFFPNEDPIGKRFCIDPTNKTYWYEIVGVVGDMHRQGLEHRTIAEYFGPWIPSSNSRADLLVRTTGDPLALVGDVRNTVKRLLPGVTVVSTTTVDAQLNGFSGLRRLQTGLLTTFAILALVLAGIGVAGLVHFTVAERTREIGVRVALGARPGDVMRLVLRQAFFAPALGIVVGVAASLVLTRVLTSFLFGISPNDPLTFAAVPAVIATVALAACWLSGRRALRVDPVKALREE